VRQQFTQKERDVETGLDYFGARYFSSMQGRFTTTDPVTFAASRMYEPQAINLYSYCGNNPLVRVDPDGRYYVGTNGKRVNVSVDSKGRVHVGGNANASLRRYAALVNKAGSSESVSAMLQTANNDTKVHFNISQDVRKTPNGDLLLGYHQAHDKNGKALEWNDKTNRWDGEPAFTKDQKGNTLYKEATITIYEGSITESLNQGKIQRKYNDSQITSDEIIVTAGTHENTHDNDRESINAIKALRKDETNKVDVEASATNAELKAAEEIKKQRKPNP
jgi:RHS repeat-associated protein